MNCEDCGKTKKPDITGELRCRPCDESIVGAIREDGIVYGVEEAARMWARDPLMFARSHGYVHEEPADE